MSRYEHQVNASSGLSENPQAPGILFDHGVLFVEVFRAEDIRGDEMNGLGKADPYLKIKSGSTGNRVTLLSKVHHNAGSYPEWNTRFKFPFRNGGHIDHNILEIEIWNRNRHTSRIRRDNCLGHIRIGELASYIKQNPHAPARWYPIFYKHHRPSKDQRNEERRGKILVKFYFSNVEGKEFANGQHTAAGTEDIEREEVSSGALHDYNRVEGKKLSAVLGGFLGISQTLILLL